MTVSADLLSNMNQQDPLQRSKEALAAAVKDELSKPIIPGEILPMDGEIETFKGRETIEITVKTWAIGRFRLGPTITSLKPIVHSNSTVNERLAFDWLFLLVRRSDLNPEKKKP